MSLWVSNLIVLVQGSEISIHIIFIFNSVCNFFYLVKINFFNLDADVSFFNVKIDFFFNYYFNVPLATLAFSVSWLTVRTQMSRVNWIID